MKEVYIIWSDSFEYDDMCSNNTIAFITDDLNIAKKKFEQYKELCKKTCNNSNWCYEYSLFSYSLNTYPIKEKCLDRIDNILND